MLLSHEEIARKSIIYNFSRNSIKDYIYMLAVVLLLVNWHYFTNIHSKLDWQIQMFRYQKYFSLENDIKSMESKALWICKLIINKLLKH